MDQTVIEQTAEGVTGDVTQIGGDYVHQDIRQQIIDFDRNVFAPATLSNTPDAYARVPSMFLEVLRKERALIIGGHADVDVTAVNQKLAAYLLEPRVYEALGLAAAPDVVRWNASANLNHTLQAIGEKTAPTVFLFVNCHIQSLAFGVSMIRDAVKQVGGLAVFSTQQDKVAWKLSPSEEHLWPEWSLAQVHPPELVHRKLTEALERSRIPSQVLSLLREDAKSILSALQTPPAIDRFLALVEREDQELDAARLNLLLQKAVEADEIVEALYRALDDAGLGDIPRERLILLCVALLCEMPTDDLLATTDVVLARAWRERVPGLRAFDYEDLEAFGPLFDFPGLQSPGDRVQSRRDGYRKTIFTMAAAQHGRFLQSALRAIAGLVEDSVVREKQWELEIFATKEQRQDFRLAISSMLGVLLSAAPGHCAGFIWRLASHGNVGVQMVAARGLAEIALAGDVDLLLHYFRELRRDSEALTKIGVAFGAPANHPHNVIRNTFNTLALALGFFVRFQNEDQLGDNVLAEIERLVGMGNLAPYALRGFLLPSVVARFLPQLLASGHAQTWAQYCNFSEAVADGLIQGAAVHGPRVADTLNAWTREGLAMPSAQSGGDARQRECLLSCVAMTYGRINYEQPQSPFSEKQAFANLALIVEKEQHRRPRAAVMEAVARQAEGDLSRFEKFLSRALAGLSTAEQDRIAQTLFVVFKRQRQAFANGEYTVPMDGVNYQVWSGQAPSTPLEQAMLRWIDDPETPELAGFALRVFSIIVTSFDMPANELIEAIKNAPDEPAPALAQVAPPAPRRSFEDWLLEKLAPVLATLGQGQYRATVGRILPAFFKDWKARKLVAEKVLGKLKGSDMAGPPIVAGSLKKGIFIVENKFWVIGGLVALLMVIVF